MPRAWASAVPGGLALNTESLAAWVTDLVDRLEFVYKWAVDGPPVVMPLGMLARPKAFLTALQQVRMCVRARTCVRVCVCVCVCVCVV